MITKRQLGLGFIALGTTAILLLFVRDLLGASQFQGIGPMQKIALLGAGLVILIGITLTPLGDKPA